MEQLGKIMVFTGVILVVAGLIVWFAGNKIEWLGRLPGDIRIVREDIKIYIPVTTMIFISIVITVILFLFRKLFH